MTTTVQLPVISDLEPSPSVSSAIAQATQPVYAFLAVQSGAQSELDTDTDEMDRQFLYLHQLGLALAQQGCQVDLFTRREYPNQPPIIEHQPGYRVIRLSAGPVKRVPYHQVLEYLPAFVDAWLDFQHRSRRNYALFQTSDWLSGWVGLQLRNRLQLPLVHTGYASGAVKYLWPRSACTMSIRHSVERSCLEKADCIVAASPLDVVELRQTISPCGQIKVVPHGIDTQHFGSLSQVAARHQLGIPLEERLILHVGQFGLLQGVDTLIEACALLPKPFRIYLVSNVNENTADIGEREFIKTLVRQMELDDQVVFVGTVPRSQLPAYYAAANVCVIPDYHGASGVVALESMAAGTPVIASEIGELRYIVRHGQTGLLVPPFNPDILSTAIWDAISNPTRWCTYGLAGEHWVRSRFSYAAVSTQMHDLYRSITFVENLKVVQDPISMGIR
jgi:glycosyltransferase involved in cell wall biosynthesis